MNGITAEIKTSLSLFTGWSVGHNPAGAASELFILRILNLAKNGEEEIANKSPQFRPRSAAEGRASAAD